MTGPPAAPAGTTPLAGKTALVTGAATGIGKAIAGTLAAAGASVVINHNHMPDLAGTVAAEITAAGGTAVAAAADVGIRAEYQSMVGQMLATFGRWDILVNNAAVAITKPFPQITEAEFDTSFAVNVKGVFHGLQLAFEHLADSGRIITISSSTTALMLPGYAVYDATKGAVEQLTHILAKEFGPRGITVNTVSPGATETGTARSRGGSPARRRRRPAWRCRSRPPGAASRRSRGCPSLRRCSAASAAARRGASTASSSARHAARTPARRCRRSHSGSPRR
jgi:3-oxoacyl-[acyl-carrier protein] reductase